MGYNENVNYILPSISNVLGYEYNGFLRQVIRYEYPRYTWEKDNFYLNDQYRNLIQEIINQ